MINSNVLFAYLKMLKKAIKMINESLKNYEYCKRVRMKLFEGSEFICATEEFTDADENDDNDEDIF